MCVCVVNTNTCKVCLVFKETPRILCVCAILSFSISIVNFIKPLSCESYSSIQWNKYLICIQIYTKNYQVKINLLCFSKRRLYIIKVSPVSNFCHKHVWFCLIASLFLLFTKPTINLISEHFLLVFSHPSLAFQLLVLYNFNSYKN